MTAHWREAARSLAHPWRRLACGLVLLALILGIDHWLLAGTHSLLATGIADETAHLATMVILLLAFPALRNIGFIVGCLVGSVVIDLDHIPLFLGSDLLTIAIVLAVAAAARGRWRWVGLGVAVGLGAHFLRDLATSTAGVLLLWPISTTGYLLPYPLYVATLALTLAWGVVTAALRTRSDKRREPGR